MNTTDQQQRRIDLRFILFPAILLVFVGLTYTVYQYGIVRASQVGSSPLGVDWLYGLRPSLLHWVNGASPYTSEGWAIFAPPWILALYLPFLLLSPELGAAVLIVLGWSAFIFVAYRLGAKPVTLAALGLAFPVLHAAGQANIDYIIPLSLLLPPQFGLFLVVAKPHIGFGIAVYWFFEAYQCGSWREVIRVFAPVTVALLISFALYGFYYVRGDNLIGEPHAISMFPYSLPFAIWLLSYAFTKKSPIMAMASSPLFSPYVGKYSWAVSFYAFIHQPKEMVIAVVLFWIGWIVQLFTGT